MATATVTPDSTAPQVNVISEQETYIKVYDPTDDKTVDGKVIHAYKVYPESDELRKDIEEGKLIEVGSQSFKFYDPQNVAGAQELVPDEEEFTNLISRGLRTKLQNKARTQMLKQDWAPVEGIVDLKDVCNEKSERRGLSQFQKLSKQLADLAPELRAQLIAMAQQMQAAQA